MKRGCFSAFKLKIAIQFTTVDYIIIIIITTMDSLNLEQSLTIINFLLI